MKRTLSIAVSSLALVLAPTPALAQDSGEPSSEEMMEMGEMFASMFTSEPLTEEQEARLPAATAIIEQIMPEGFYVEIMQEAMGSTLEPMMAIFGGVTGADLVLGARLDVEEATKNSLSDDEKIELATLLDPAFAQRGVVMQELMNGLMRETAIAIEPGFRIGMAKAYAVRFDNAQLADIATFFATPTGSTYAQESMKLMTDPQVMSASMQAMPQMMQQFGGLEEQMKEAMAALPAERSVDDLDTDQQTRAAALLGVDADSLTTVVKPPKPGSM